MTSNISGMNIILQQTLYRLRKRIDRIDSSPGLQQTYPGSTGFTYPKCVHSCIQVPPPCKSFCCLFMSTKGFAWRNYLNECTPFGYVSLWIWELKIFSANLIFPIFFDIFGNCDFFDVFEHFDFLIFMISPAIKDVKIA